MAARPALKPAGMEHKTEPKPANSGQRGTKRRKTAQRVIHEERIVKAAVPAGSRFKGYEDFVVQDLVLRPHVVRIRRERWLTPDGDGGGADADRDHRPIGCAALRPAFGIGPELRRFVLLQYHQGQVTMPRLLAQLRAIGLDISKRQVVRLLNAGQDVFLDEARAVLRAGLETGAWISVDDTLARLAADPDQRFADAAAWQRHLDRLGITGMRVTPDPVQIATEGALWGAIQDHGLLPDTVVLSDDAGQFAVGHHALYWLHAERLVHKLETFTDRTFAAQQRQRGLIWWFYADLKAYRRAPDKARWTVLRARFERIFGRRTGFATLDRLLERLQANKEELLVVLDRPEVPLHTNGSERDLRAQVTRRKISGGTRSDQGRDCRDAFAGLLLTCTKLGISFWDYLGHRLGMSGADAPYLPDLVRMRSAEKPAARM